MESLTIDTLRIIPEMCARRAFHYLNEIENMRWGKVELIEASRTIYTSHRLYCFGRSFQEANAGSHGKILQGYYSDTVNSEKYHSDWMLSNVLGRPLVNDYNLDPFVQNRAFTIRIDFTGYPDTMDFEKATKVVESVFRSYGFTVTESVRYGKPALDCVMNYGGEANYAVVDDTMSYEMRVMIGRLLLKWSKRRNGYEPKIGLDDVPYWVRQFKEFECKRDTSSNKEVPSIGYKSLELLLKQ